MAAFGLILIALNLSPLVTYARRSLEEIFSSFISLFLILKAIFGMFKVRPGSLQLYLVESMNLTDFPISLGHSPELPVPKSHYSYTG